MVRKKCPYRKRFCFFASVLLSAWILAACGRETDSDRSETAQAKDSSATEERIMIETPETTSGASKQSEEKSTSAAVPSLGDAEAAESSERHSKEAALQERFGDSCITSQTFEVSLSEYDGKVYFVPYAPSAESAAPYIRLVQGETLLTEFSMWIPDEFSSEDFKSLDAVSFYDVNYDGNTDILMLLTCGDASFAAVYYGYSENTGGIMFVPQEELSANLTAKVSPLTVPAIRGFLSNGKKNGEFADYQEAYAAVSRLYDLEHSAEQGYDLVYFDSDETPELVAGAAGFYTSLYTYSRGSVYTLMDRWVYGAMGNAGYEFSPRKNSLRNYNSDYAGAILYTTYMAVSGQYTMDVVSEIVTYNFDDVNGNGIPDPDEEGSLGLYGMSYIDGREASPEECAALDAGEYVPLQIPMTFEMLQKALAGK